MSNEFLSEGREIAKLPSDYGSTGFKMFKGASLIMLRLPMKHGARYLLIMIM